ncbi:hypothetical protein ACLOJK_027363 [Asimina triloba]
MAKGWPPRCDCKSSKTTALHHCLGNIDDDIGGESSSLIFFIDDHHHQLRPPLLLPTTAASSSKSISGDELRQIRLSPLNPTAISKCATRPISAELSTSSRQIASSADDEQPTIIMWASRQQPIIMKFGRPSTCPKSGSSPSKFDNK